MFQLLIPVADPWKRYIHNDPSVHPRRINRCKRVADHIAEVVSDESNFLNCQFVQNAGEVLSLSDLFVQHEPTLHSLNVTAVASEVKEKASLIHLRQRLGILHLRLTGAEASLFPLLPPRPSDAHHVSHAEL
jgi:hypothetical protein